MKEEKRVNALVLVTAVFLGLFAQSVHGGPCSGGGLTPTAPTTTLHDYFSSGLNSNCDADFVFNPANSFELMVICSFIDSTESAVEGKYKANGVEFYKWKQHGSGCISREQDTTYTVETKLKGTTEEITGNYHAHVDKETIISSWVTDKLGQDVAAELEFNRQLYYDAEAAAFVIGLDTTSCASLPFDGGFVATDTSLTLTTAVVGPLSPATYKVCVSVDGGAFFYEQDDTIEVVANPSTTALSASSPGVLVAGTDKSPAQLSLSGLTKTATTYVALSTTGNCDTIHYGAIHYHQGVAGSNQAFTENVPVPGSYVVCYTINGVDWYEQSNISPIEFVRTAETDLVNVGPRTIGAGVTNTIGLDITDITGDVYVTLTGGTSGPCDEDTSSVTPATCTGGEVIVAVKQAYLGDAAYATCSGATAVSDCGVDVSDVVRSLCLGQTQCTVDISADLSMFGGPCDGSEQLVVEFICGDCAGGTTAGPYSSVDDVTVSSSLAAGYYGVCLERDISGDDPVLQTSSGAALNVIAPSTTDIAMVYPNSIGEDVFPSVIFAGLVSTPTTMVALVTAGQTCNSNRITATETLVATGSAPVLLTDASGSVPGGTSYDVCLSHGPSSNWVKQTDVSIWVAESSPATLSTTPSSYIAGNTPELSFPGAVVTDTGTVIRIASDSGCSSSEADYDYTGSGTFTAPALSAATYYVCYSVDDGGNFELTSDTITVVTVSGTVLTDMDPDAVYIGSDGAFPSMTLTGGTPSVDTYVAFIESGAISATDCALASSGPVNMASSTVTFSAAMAAGTYKLCYSASGPAASEYVFQTTKTFVVYGTAGATDITSVTVTAPNSGYIVDGDTGIALTVSAAVTPPPNAMIGLAENGRCSSNRLDQAAYSATVTGLSVDVTPGLTGTVTIYTCYSADGTVWVQQTNGATQITVAVNHNFVITSASPDVFIVGVNPVVVAHSGLYASDTTFVALAAKGTTPCASVPSPVAVTSGNEASYSSIPVGDLTVCYSISGSGGPYVEQKAVTITQTTNPDAGRVKSVSPRFLGAGSTPTLTMTWEASYPTGTTAIAFAYAGQCNITRFSVTSWTADNPTQLAIALPESEPTGVELKVCYTDATTGWNEQVTSGVLINVVNPSTTTVSAVTPASGPAGLLRSFELSFTTDTQIATPTTVISFTESDCGSAFASQPLRSGSTVNVTLPATETDVYLCVSTGGAAELQATPVITVLEADADSVTSADPTTLPAGFTTVVTISGPPLSAEGVIGFGAQGGGCALPMPLNFSFDGSDPCTSPPCITVPTSVPAGTYELCYSVDGGTSFVDQNFADVVVVGAGTGDITDVQPSPIGAVTTPVMTISGGTQFGSSYVAFHPDAGTCSPANQLRGFTKLEGGSVVTLGAQLYYQLNPYTVCYAVNYDGFSGGDWVPQTFGTLTVIQAEPSSIATLTPSVIAAGTQPTLSFFDGTQTPIVSVPFARVAFVGTGESCSAVNFRGLTHINVTSQNVQLGSPISQLGNQALCYTTSNGALWIKQTTPLLSVFAASALSVSSLSPYYVGQDTSPTFTLTDGSDIATPTSVFAFALSTDDCSVPGDRVAETAYTTDAPTTVSADLTGPAGTYKLCFSSDGTSFFDQDETIELRVAGATDITGVSPGYISARTTPKLVASGAVPILTAELSFVPDTAACTVGNIVSTISLAAGEEAANMSAPFTTGGLYEACYTVDGGASYTKQTGFKLTVTNGTDTEAVAFTPAAVGAGTTPTLTVTPGTAFPPQSKIGVAALGSRRAGPCDSPGSFDFGPVDFAAAFSIATPLTAGDYAVCVATDGSNYVQQSLVLTVVDATTTSITAILPGFVFDEGATPTGVRFVGAVGTATTRVAFTALGGCAALNTIYSSTPNFYATFDIVVSNVSVNANGPLSSGETYANLSVCYTVDDGASWHDQSLVYATVDSACGDLVGCGLCNSNSKCAYCLQTGVCAAVSSHPNCTGIDLIRPNEVCPTIQTPSVRMPDDGNLDVILQVTDVVVPANSKIFACLYEDSSMTGSYAATRVDNTHISCPVPAQGGAESVRQLSILYGGEDYSINWIVFQYYDCEAYSLPDGDETVCSQCYDASDRPLCGTCLTTNMCTTNATCSKYEPLPWIGDGDCPTIARLQPASVVFGAKETIVVTGSTEAGSPDPFFESTQYGCMFEGSGDFKSGLMGATFIDSTTIECDAPVYESDKDKALTVHFSVWYNGSSYTTEESLLYAPPAATPEQERDVTGIIVGSSSGFVFIVAALVIAGVLYWRHRQWKLAHTPPPLTQSMRETIVFGKFKDFGGEHDDVRPEINQLVQLLMIPGNHFAFAVTEVTAATEADNVAKSLAVLYENEGMMVEMLMDFIEREVFLCTKQSTLFRTNSFATKMFKTYSKMQGVDYLHDTLGFVLNTELSENKDITFDLKSDDAQMAAFTLLTVCQRIFMRIVKSESDVPPAFRKIFHHVQTCMAEKFPVTSGDIADVVASQLQQRLTDTSDAFQLGALAYRDVDQLRALITADLEDLAQVIVPMQDRFNNFKTCVTTLDDQINVMLKDFDKLEGALVPNSAAARRVLEEHTRAQNSVAVGGFFFLRFLVPAITAPEAYHLVRELPTPDQRKLLVMVGKVVQNLSNGLEFGKKEQHMVKLNEFIVQNRNVMYQLFDKLSTPTDEVVVPCRVPPGVLQSAKFVIFEHVCRSYDKIVDKMMTPTEDASFDNKCQQICNMFRLQMDAINAKKAKKGRGMDSMSFSLATTMSGDDKFAAYDTPSSNFGDDYTASKPGGDDGGAGTGGEYGSVLDDVPVMEFNPNDLLGSFSNKHASVAASETTYTPVFGEDAGGYDDTDCGANAVEPPSPRGPPPPSPAGLPPPPPADTDGSGAGTPDKPQRPPNKPPSRSNSLNGRPAAPPNKPPSRNNSVSGRPAPSKPSRPKPKV